MLSAERVRCVGSRPYYGLNLLQRRLLIGRSFSFTGEGIAVTVGRGVRSVVLPAFRHFE